LGFYELKVKYGINKTGEIWDFGFWRFGGLGFGGLGFGVWRFVGLGFGVWGLAVCHMLCVFFYICVILSSVIPV